MALPESISINGKTFASADLGDAARVQVKNIQVVDAEIARLQLQLAIAQTARNAYAGALTAALNAPAKAQPVVAMEANGAAAGEPPAKKARKARATKA
jgi:hypothetical protein